MQTTEINIELDSKRQTPM